MKRITIVGGGISGLTVLHYLKRHLGTAAEITLFEREPHVGGTIRSIFQDNSCLFEWGPNGFLDNQPQTLQLIQELGLNDQLIEAAMAAKGRYLQVKGRLLPLPAGFFDFISTPVLSLSDKWSLIRGLFRKGISTDRSIYDYVCRRFSKGIAEQVIDPFISGIYAGDIRRLHMASAFPRMRAPGFKKNRMLSFKRGMAQIIEALEHRYKQNIVKEVEFSASRINANITIIATPAYAASVIVRNLNPVLSALLDQIHYAPLAVVGLLFKKEMFKQFPEGLGYLVPSKENKDVLGVLVESNAYSGRAGNDEVLLRVMLGGAHHPAIIDDSNERLINKAIKEIDAIYGLTANPINAFVKPWPKAIPQYEINYPSLRQSIAQQCARTPGLYLCANYLDGIAFNDCIRNARSLAGLIKI